MSQRTAPRPSIVDRRAMLRGLGAALAVAPFVPIATLVGCNGSTDDGSAGTTSSSGDGTGASSGTTSSSGSTSSSGTGSANAWASGGTKAMTAKASYPNPFAAAATSCVMLKSATEGPCTEAADQVREDVSEGYTGLPVRLVFRILDTACNPIAGATVKIWHTQINGSYSGDTPNPGMCLKSSAEAEKHYFRGKQTADEDGVVAFDTCFPGWYRGRAIHIHYTVTANGKSFTSQVAFDQTLIDEIFTTHPEYQSFGTPDTPNASDNVLGNASLATYMLSTQRMSDGAMLASKELIVFT